MSIINATKSNYSDTLSNNPLVLVDFYADWCGPCKMLAPILKELSTEMPNLTIVKVNIDNSPELAEQYGVMSIPTMLVFKNGKEVNKKVGMAPKAAIINMLK